MPLIEDYIENVAAALVIVPDTLDAAINAALDREIKKWPDTEKDREVLCGQLISFFSVYGYLPEFSIEPRAEAPAPIVEGPYPGCHHPEKCNATGRCPRDPVCFN